MTRVRFEATGMGHPVPAGEAFTGPALLPGQHIKRPLLHVATEAALMTALRSGVEPRVACGMSGVPYGTFRKWLYRAEGKEPGRPASPEYVRFARMVGENIAAAQAYGEASALQKRPLEWNDVFGSDTWRERRREIREGSVEPPPQAQQSVVVNVGTTEQNLTVIEIAPERMPDFLRSVIEQTRRDRAEIVASQQAGEEQQDIPDGHRSPRLDGLRATLT